MLPYRMPLCNSGSLFSYGFWFYRNARNVQDFGLGVGAKAAGAVVAGRASTRRQGSPDGEGGGASPADSGNPASSGEVGTPSKVSKVHWSDPPFVT